MAEAQAKPRAGEARIFPLVNKDGMPEIAEKLYLELRKDHTCQFDAKQSIGKRYARMDEAGRLSASRSMARRSRTKK